MSQLEQVITLINAVTVPTVSNELIIIEGDTLLIEISGTSDSRTVTFSKKLFVDGVTTLTNVFNESASTLAASTTGNNEILQIDTSGLYSIIVSVTAVAGGNVTVKAKVIK